MGLYSGGLIIGKISASEIWGLIFGRAYFRWSLLSRLPTVSFRSDDRTSLSREWAKESKPARRDCSEQTSPARLAKWRLAPMFSDRAELDWYKETAPSLLIIGILLYFISASFYSLHFRPARTARLMACSRSRWWTSEYKKQSDNTSRRSSGTAPSYPPRQLKQLQRLRKTETLQWKELKRISRIKIDSSF